MSLKDSLQKVASDEGMSAGGLAGGFIAPLAAHAAYTPLGSAVDKQWFHSPTDLSPERKRLLSLGKAAGTEIKIKKDISPFTFFAKDRKFVKTLSETAVGRKILEKWEYPRKMVEAITEGNLAKDLVVITPSTGAGTLAHEMGHAHPRSLPSKLLVSKELRALSAAGAPVALGIAGAAGLMHRLSSSDEVKEEAASLARIGAGVGALAAAPVLGEELRANIYGVKKLRELGMSWKDILKKTKTIRKAQLSYPATMLAVPLGILLGSLAMKPKKERE